MKEEENSCSVRRLNVWGLFRHLATFMLTLCSQHVSNITELTLVRVLISNLVFVSVLTCKKIKKIYMNIIHMVDASHINRLSTTVTFSLFFSKH